MKPIKSYWLLLAAAASFFAVGIPYWLVPYHELNLPSGLLTPGLALVAAAPLLLRMFRLASFWRATLMIGGSVGAVVMSRVLVDVVRDATSHNLWPIELVIALVVGLGCALAGAVVGTLMARLLANDAEGH
ncbi:MAG: hypothetical protein ABFC67_07585 [Mizugakiibacter sp.]|uniref:hypothetical protein n=1 Tax=Mizugakiibacter sp. TaxID=1972610 RepID=UPI0031CA69CB|nr:hypothetical protein [Xanthomonadaceae bacterium]